MSIEVMKRIKALLQDTKMIDSHTISAVVAECDTAILTQQPATGEPVYWEWRHLSTHPDTVDFGKWSEWKRVEARSAIHTIEDALAEFRAYIAQGYKYELRALYTHPAPSVPDGHALVPIEPTQEMLLAYTGGAVTNAGFSWCRHQWSVMLAAAAPAAHPAPSTPSLIAEAISSGHFGVLPMKATIPMCKAGWGASGGELTFQQIGHIYEEMYKARPLPDDA